MNVSQLPLMLACLLRYAHTHMMHIRAVLILNNKKNSVFGPNFISFDIKRTGSAQPDKKEIFELFFVLQIFLSIDKNSQWM